MNKFQLILIVANLIVFDSANATELTENTFSTYVDKIGKIRLPESFRQQWVHLGSWLVSDAKAPGHGFHDVYTQA